MSQYSSVNSASKFDLYVAAGCCLVYLKKKDKQIISCRFVFNALNIKKKCANKYYNI